ncbi:AraC-like DNA-binding protein [Nakamurella sp. UYEF19]|uniref:AraC family transcriptional regulator n=1 Tax=Nakamurella sp. UYEF19 TaxID=1756392 RepID=UPI003392A7B9
MLAAFEHIVPTYPLTWKITSFAVPEFESVWHFHREFELTYIRQGSGTRLIGDSVGDYSPGNLTLIGPEVPHTYVSTPGDTEHEAVVIQFKRDFLGRGFFDAPVFDGVSSLLDRASRGVSFTWADAPLRRLEQLPPAEKTVELLGLLLELSHHEAPLLAGEHESPALNKATAGRIESMVALMHREFASRLTLAQIAGAAHLAPSSASRVFARSTGSNVTIYLNVVRVNAACRLLRDTDLNISTVATDCGFSNLSNFNRRFRDVKNMTPRDYRAGFELT